MISYLPPDRNGVVYRDGSITPQFWNSQLYAITNDVVISSLYPKKHRNNREDFDILNITRILTKFLGIRASLFLFLFSRNDEPFWKQRTIIVWE